MTANNVRKMIFELLGRQDDEPLHIQTVKITETAHARLRALADLMECSKTPLAGDLLMAAINDAIEALPNDPLDEAKADRLRGVLVKGGVSHFDEPRGVRDIVLERAEGYLSLDQHERLEKEAAALSDSVAAGKNGVLK